MYSMFNMLTDSQEQTVLNKGLKKSLIVFFLDEIICKDPEILGAEVMKNTHTHQQPELGTASVVR
jgi:hypothetical protein